MYTYVDTYLNKHACMCICVIIYVYEYVYVYVHVYVYVCICICINVQYASICIFAKNEEIQHSSMSTAENHAMFSLQSPCDMEMFSRRAASD